MADSESSGYINKELDVKDGVTEVDGKKWVTRTTQNS